jgi:hypothetical protein
MSIVKCVRALGLKDQQFLSRSVSENFSAKCRTSMFLVCVSRTEECSGKDNPMSVLRRNDLIESTRTRNE